MDIRGDSQNREYAVKSVVNKADFMLFHGQRSEPWVLHLVIKFLTTVKCPDLSYLLRYGKFPGLNWSRTDGFRL